MNPHYPDKTYKKLMEDSLAEFQKTRVPESPTRKPIVRGCTSFEPKKLERTILDQMTLLEFRKKLNMSHGSMQRMLNGETAYITDSMVKRIEDVLGIKSSDYFPEAFIRVFKEKNPPRIISK